MKIDWDDIKISFVPADKEHPNELNPYAKLSAKEREQAIVSISGKIWARSIKEGLLKEKCLDLVKDRNIIPFNKGTEQKILDLKQK